MLGDYLLRLVLVVLLLGLGSLCFSSDGRHNLKEWQSESLNHLGYGYDNLLAHDPCGALEEFQKANSLLDRSDNSASVISFLISFGQSIAYDALGFSEHCTQAVGSMFFAMNSYDEDVSEVELETDGLPEYDSSIGFLRDLITIAPSYEAQELLTSLVDEIEEQLLPDFKFAKQPVLGSADYIFDCKTNDFTSFQCKSFWKKFTKWANRVLEFLHLAEKASDHAKNIKKNIDEIRNSNQYQDPHYVNPNMRVR
jgi:hypothetical protein